jgi:ribosome-binding factor A
MSDPRFDPVKTSITRVEVPEDLLTARVYLSVAGPTQVQNQTLAALQHAAGYLQEKMMDRIELRHTPKLEFVLDTQFKKTMETLAVISEVSEELRQIDADRQADATPPAPGDAQQGSA